MAITSLNLNYLCQKLVFKFNLTFLVVRKLLLLLVSQNLPDSPARRARRHSTAGFSIHFITAGLLQLIISSARVNYSASAACDECSGPSHYELIIVQPRETSIEIVTLAAG